MKTLKINQPAVWILVLIHQIIGGIWYSPFLFANKWMMLTGKTAEQFSNADAVKPYVVSFISSIITVYTMAYLFKKLNVENFISGMFFAFLFWIAFLYVELATNNSFELRPYGLTLINGGKSLVTFLVSGFVLGFWKKYDVGNTEVETK